MSGIYQHRRVEIVPGEQAGSFKMLLVDTDPSSVYCGRWSDVATRYVAAYEATGLRQSLGACYGRVGLSVSSSPAGAMERMGMKEMVAYRAWLGWRRMMPSAAASEVDDVLLHGHVPSNRSLLFIGLRALARRKI